MPAHEAGWIVVLFGQRFRHYPGRNIWETEKKARNAFISQVRHLRLMYTVAKECYPQVVGGIAYDDHTVEIHNFMQYFENHGMLQFVEVK